MTDYLNLEGTESKDHCKCRQPEATVSVSTALSRPKRIIQNKKITMIKERKLFLLLVHIFRIYIYIYIYILYIYILYKYKDVAKNMS